MFDICNNAHLRDKLSQVGEIVSWVVERLQHHVLHLLQDPGLWWWQLFGVVCLCFRGGLGGAGGLTLVTVAAAKERRRLLQLRGGRSPGWDSRPLGRRRSSSSSTSLVARSVVHFVQGWKEVVH